MDGSSGSSRQQPSISGWLYKWTNYLSGYKKRWFVLSEGVLCYYRNQEEMPQTCRGTLSLAGATIESDETCHFVVANGETYHMKAENEAERERWVKALILARELAVEEKPPDGSSEATSMAALVARMRSKLKLLQTCNALINKHGLALQRSISEIETSTSLKSETNFKVNEVTERAALLRATTSSMINACSEYLDLAECHGEKWAVLIQEERQQRERLEKIVESLTALHNTSKSQKKKTANGSDDDSSVFYDCDDEESSPRSGATHLLPLFHVYSALRNESPSGMPGPSKRRSSHVTQGQPYGSLRDRRTRVPDRPPVSANLWSIIKNCIGKDLTKMPVPVSFLEPLSLLQRLTEDFEYGYLLDVAADFNDPGQQLAYVVAFAVSAYSTTISRTGKPFNPLLGETYECDRMEDLGWRSIAEQVSHHPPIAALFCEGKQWQCWMEESMCTKFRGQTLTIIPLGEAHVKFKNGAHYSWHKVSTNIHNIIIGKLWIDQEGDLDVVCHTSKYKAKVSFLVPGYFSGQPHSVKGNVMDPKGTAIFTIEGGYDSKLEMTPVPKTKNDSSVVLWQRVMPPADCDKYYNMTLFACQLNEMEDGVAPTDSRRRPDQRLMEEGKFDEANALKKTLEDIQRSKRNIAVKPCWFTQSTDPDTKVKMHVYGGEYWKSKEKKDWSRCPKGIFGD